MIKSMTGFGRAEYSDEKRRITVEIKAVNHRYLDCSIKMPKKLSFFEASIRTLLKDYIQRGKVDVFITYEDYTENNLNLKYNRDMARAYYSYLKEMAEEFGIENDVRVSTLSRYPEVFSLEEADVDEDEIWSDLDKVIREAATHFVDARITEGENLKRDLCDKLDTMLTYVADIEKRAPQIIEEYKDTIFVDDYAHHPTEVKVTIEASRKRYPNRKIIAIFKPHRASRVLYFAKQFKEALEEADEIYLLDFTSIDDKQDGTDIDITYLANMIPGSIILPENDEGAKMLAKYKGECLVFMSSKDIYNIAERVKELI